MRRSHSRFVIGLLLLVGCGQTDPGSDPPAGCPPEVGTIVAGTVEREAWSIVFDQVPLVGDITSVLVGGSGCDNFNNRGDVEVRVDGPEGVITVEARRFAAGDTAAQIEANIDHLSVVASAGAEPSSANDCADGWMDACRVTVFDDRGIQPASSGADLRVTLPASYRGEIEIETADQLAVEGFFGRSDVWVAGAAPNLEVLLDSGEARVYVDRDARPGTGLCTEAEIDGCEGWTRPGSGTLDPWSIDCGCTDYGSIAVSSRGTQAANITVDVPPTLWATVRGNNKQPGLTPDADPTCAVTVDCSNLADCRDEQFEATQPWRRTTELNDPLPDEEASTAVAGGGVQLALTSESCGLRDVHEAPGDFPGPPQQAKRGDVQVCSGCLEALLP